LPFSAFEKVSTSERAAVWRGDDLLQIGFLMQRPAGTSGWAELDNVAFY
jgi:hypothetical protein